MKTHTIKKNCQHSNQTCKKQDEKRKQKRLLVMYYDNFYY